MAFKTLWCAAATAGALLTLAAGDAGAQTVTATQTVAPPAQQAQSNAAPPSGPAPVKILDEVKFGALAHDVALGGHHRESGTDVNLELLFASPEIFKYILRPRPHVGADINSDGKTSNYYAGLTWGGIFYRPNVFVGDGFFGYFSFGPSVNDGLISTTDRTRKSLGSHVLFKEGIDLGYQLSPRLSLAAFVDHISNAGLANRNEGITNAGARIGVKF